jgi:hypothetical protein
MGRIQLVTSPPGARLTLDGKPVPNVTPTVLDAPAESTAHLVVALEGYQPLEQDLLFAAGTRPLALALVKVAESPPPPPPPRVERGRRDAAAGKGRMSIFVRPYAMVSVDGRPVGQTPLPGLELAAGRHTIELVNDKLRRRARVVLNIHPGENPELRRDFTN